MIIFAVNKAQYSVRLLNANKVSGVKKLQIEMVSPPSGKRSVGECGVRFESLHCFPQSHAQLEDFFAEQFDFLHDMSARSGEDMSQQALVKIHSISVAMTNFRRMILRLCDVVLLPYPKLHITIYAVILRFLLVTWNMAMAHDDIDLLTTSFQQRFERDYQPLLFGANMGETVQGIADAMTFIHYICPSHHCSAVGMAAEHCFHCSIGVHCSGGGGGGSDKDGGKGFTEAAYKAWRGKIESKGSKEDITRAAFKKTLPLSTSAAPTRAQARTVVSTYTALARNQSVICAPGAAYEGHA
jgi:hypothetical protein